MLYKIDGRHIPMTYIGDYGCFVALEKGILYSCPASNTLPPEPVLEHYGAVECVDADGRESGLIFLKQVNQLYGTKFTIEDFDSYRMAMVKF